MQVETTGHIYLVDDDASIRSALTGMLKRQGFTVNAYASADEFLKYATPVSPAVLVLDMRMPNQNGADLQLDLAKHGWTTPTIFISGESLPAQIVQAMKQGASDFLLKPFSMQELLNAVDRALEKDRANHALLIKALAVEKLYATLTPREREVFDAIIVGKTNKQIATTDGSAAATIKLHRSRILAKMQVDSVAALIALISDIDISALRLRSLNVKHPLTP
jgi:FixJ family two-component response regulator